MYLYCFIINKYCQFINRYSLVCSKYLFLLKSILVLFLYLYKNKKTFIYFYIKVFLRDDDVFYIVFRLIICAAPPINASPRARNIGAPDDTNEGTFIVLTTPSLSFPDRSFVVIFTV